MTLRDAALDDKYGFEGRPYYLNGTQALVRLTMLERRRRAAEGKHTAVYCSGYRGSPLGSFDQAMFLARDLLGPDIVMRPGVNEDIAATAIWGTQQLGVLAEGRYDGVSALWYGKGPGVDRTGDVFKHANLAGSAREGGVLVVAGDDHNCKSSSTAHQSEYALVDASIPVLAPATLSEIMEYGLLGWEMSRFTGLWVSMKVVTELMDSSGPLAADPIMKPVRPDFEFPPGGLSIRWPDTFLGSEERLFRWKLPAATAFIRAAGIDRIVLDSRKAKLGIITVGKSHLDTMQALAELGIDEVRAADLGLRLYKVGCPWPLEPEGVRAFAKGLTQIIVVEEKRGLIEDQLRKHLYGLADAPVIVGKNDEAGRLLFPVHGELETDKIALALGERILHLTGDKALAARLTPMRDVAQAFGGLERLAERTPHFCPGCPHSTSTKVPEGSRAFSGIGCHFLVQLMDTETAGYTHMGGEGGNWIGLAPFAKHDHVFQNMGDGTYFHSGYMAIRAAIAAKVNMTYKILFNGAVAMTGGQPIDGELSPAAIAAQVTAEGARRVVVVADDPSRHPEGSLPPGVALYHRRDLDKVQRELRAIAGVTVLIYDQPCATELRRNRKRGKVEDPQVAVVINDLVCEGCGDCSVKSKCLSVTPVDTEFGRKRSVDLSTCNKDRSCLNGFCPSFVTVEGARRKKPATADAPKDLPAPAAAADRASIIVTGIGGTGVVTIGALISMAAHLEGKSVRTMDQTGLAQKGGAVVSHIQLAPAGHEIHSSRITAGAADLLLGCDAVVAGSPEHLSRLGRAGRVIANEHESITSRFTREVDFALPMRPLRRQLASAVEPGNAEFLDATDLATRLVGDAVGTNLFLVGYAFQKGLIPLTAKSLDRAIELNATAVSLNRSAFAWGRKAAVDLDSVKAAARGGSSRPDHHRLSDSLGETIARREAFLADYQDKAYAARYRTAIDRLAAAEAKATPDRQSLAMTAARGLFKVMAYKDEYEVARLHADMGFKERLSEQFEDGFTVTYHLAPPLFAARDPNTGELQKRRYGPWMGYAFKALAKLKGLRGTPFDIFGYAQERRDERARVQRYLALMEEIGSTLTPASHAEAIALLATFDSVRGYGHVKHRNAAAAEAQEGDLLRSYREAKGSGPVKDELAASMIEATPGPVSGPPASAKILG